jgi:DNA-binding NarL/FixJ family response regulator
MEFLKMVIDRVDNQIIQMIVNGSHVTEIAEDTKKSKRYVLYRLSDLKTSFNCKTTPQLIYMLATSGLIK